MKRTEVITLVLVIALGVYMSACVPGTHERVGATFESRREIIASAREPSFAALGDDQHTTGAFGDPPCNPAGDGGDAALNRLKNRDLPPDSYAPESVAEILEETPTEAEAMGRKKRSRWSADALEEVAKLENHGVSVEGVLLRVKVEGPESCNCHSSTNVDRHMWLATDPEDDRSESMVVEISPRLRGVHPNWTDERLRGLATQHAKVRISGWALWDEEHPEQVGRTRGTLWEIHPIHKIEVWQDSRWMSLDDM